MSFSTIYIELFISIYIFFWTTLSHNLGSDVWRARLTVTSPEHLPPPVIELGPANQTLPLRTLAVLRCLATGSPPPIITWYKAGVPVTKGHDRINITETGTLVINGRFLISLFNLSKHGNYCIFAAICPTFMGILYITPLGISYLQS